MNGDGRGDGYFIEAGREVGFAHIAGTMGLIAHDFNADGYIDVCAGNGGPSVSYQLEEDLFYVNNGPAWPADFLANPAQPLRQALFEVGALAGTYSNLYMAHGMTALRGDAGTDLMVSNGGPAIFNSGQENVYYANQGLSDGREPRTLALDLIENTSAPAALGTRVEVLRGRAGAPVHRTVLERHQSTGFSGANFEALTFGLGDEDALYASVTWSSGIRQGVFLLPSQVARGQRAERLPVSEPTLSMELSNGGSGVRIRLHNTSMVPLQGTLQLEVLEPLLLIGAGSGAAMGAGQSRGLHVNSGNPPSPKGPRSARLGRRLGEEWFLCDPEVLQSNVLIPPGQTRTFQHPLTAEAEPGLYRYSFRLPGPPAGARPAAEAARWHAARVAPVSTQRNALGLSDLAPWSGDLRPSPASPSAPRPVLQVRRALEMAVDGLRVERFGASPGARSIDTSPRGRMTLVDGTRLAWEDGRVRVRPSATRPAVLQFDGERVLLVSGAPMSCCENQPPSGDVQVIELEPAAGTLVLTCGNRGSRRPKRRPRRLPVHRGTEKGPGSQDRTGIHGRPVHGPRAALARHGRSRAHIFRKKLGRLPGRRHLRGWISA